MSLSDVLNKNTVWTALDELFERFVRKHKKLNMVDKSCPKVWPGEGAPYAP